MPAAHRAPLAERAPKVLEPVPPVMRKFAKWVTMGPMKRRTFVGVAAGVLCAAPLTLKAQPSRKVYRIGYLVAGQGPSYSPDQGPFPERMRELGWVYGRNFVMDRRAYGDGLDRVSTLASELIRAGVDVFVVTGAADAARVQQATRTIPIVAWGAGDFVAAGLAASLARPGGNVTGIQTLQPELGSKHLSLVKEALPHVARVGVLFQQAAPSRQPLGLNAAVFREVESAGKTLGIEAQAVVINDAAELEGAFSTFRTSRVQAVVVVRNQFMGIHVNEVVTLAAKYRLPTISDMNHLAQRGGFISYGFSIDDTIRQAADLVSKILRGAKPGETPIQQAATFRIVINMATAKAIGLTIPPAFLARADQVIH